jgi:LEA14-like dessication related protein
MNLKRWGLIIVLVLMGLLFLFNRKDLVLTSQNNFAAVPIGQTGYELNSVIHVNNPNLLSSTVKTISEKFYLNGKSIAILNLEINQGIPGMKETSFPITVRFNKDDLYQIFPADTGVMNISAQITVTGEISFENMMSSGKIQIDQKDSLTIPGL